MRISSSYEISIQNKDVNNKSKYFCVMANFHSAEYTMTIPGNLWTLNYATVGQANDILRFSFSPITCKIGQD